MVFVYRNLNRKGVVWSVKSVKSGLIVARSQSVLIKNATLKVSKAGRKRVIKEKRKNVHAGVKGTWVRGERDYRRATADMYRQRLRLVRVSYNPYKNETFVLQKNRKTILNAKYVFLHSSGAWATVR